MGWLEKCQRDRNGRRKPNDVLWGHENTAQVRDIELENGFWVGKGCGTRPWVGQSQLE